MDFIWSIVIGLIVGLFARALMPGKDPMGLILTTLLGIGGALLGGFLGKALGIYQEGQRAGFLMSLIGAMILLFIYHHVKRRNTILPPQ